MTTTTPSDASAHLAHCPCGAEVRSDGLRDRASYEEFRITGLCQACQDRIFLATCATDPAKRFALRHGAVVAHDAARDELAALPFLYTAEPRIAWDAHRIVRIGERLKRLDPHRALAPMADALTGHAVCVHESATVHDPAVPVRLAGIDLLIVLDRITRRAVDTLPLPSPHHVIVLADEAHWRAHHATSLPELERAWAEEPEPHRSTLRTCALLGWALARLPDGAATGAPPLHAFLDDPHRSE